MRKMKSGDWRGGVSQVKHQNKDKCSLSARQWDEAEVQEVRNMSDCSALASNTGLAQMTRCIFSWIILPAKTILEVFKPRNDLFHPLKVRSLDVCSKEFDASHLLVWSSNIKYVRSVNTSHSGRVINTGAQPRSSRDNASSISLKNSSAVCGLS